MSGRFNSMRSHSSASTDPEAIAFPAATDLGSDPRPVRKTPPPNSRSSFSTNTLSGSLTHRTPARSFVHQASVHGSDPAQYNSVGVREQTAQLASWTLNSSPTRLDPSQPGRSNSSTGPENGQSARRPSELSRPEVIHEISEPVSPDGLEPSSPKSPPQNSALARMFQSRARGQDPSPSRTKPRQPSQSPASHAGDSLDGTNERTPLLARQDGQDAGISKDPKIHHDVESLHGRQAKQNNFRRMLGEGQQRTKHFFTTAISPKRWSAKAVWEKGVLHPITLLPCVFLGVLLNLLDALSYGMILFPLGEPIFAQTGPSGISIFFVSTIIAQLVYSCGGSIFKGAVGSEMIEVVPFFHKMTYTVMDVVGKDKPNAVLATVIVSYALSSIMTGVVFFLLGAFKLGSLVNFFPRNILIGCIGGVGFFLFVTGIEVSSRLDGNLEYNLPTAKKLFQADTILLWIIPLAQAIMLMGIKYFFQSPYIVPAFFIAVAGIFYIVVVSVPDYNLPLLRDQGWIFAQVDAGVPFYHFYSYYDFTVVHWGAVAECIPAMLALTFFGILHVPINVPALAIAAEEDDLNLNRELVAHGVSNALSGLCGSIQNYLVYVNSEMFISNGGNSRLAGLMLAAATFGVLVAGPGLIGYVPIMVVGALIYYLGIELLKEALWETWGKMNKLEYLTVVVIVLTMGVYDFVGGILVGIVAACLNFVVQTSSKSSIRATYSGESVESTVRRHPVQRHFLQEVGYQIYVTKLAGMLFFGSIVLVEKKSRALIEEEAFRAQPIRYLIFDFTHVRGLDYSAAEAFQRIERVLGRRDVHMIISGVERDSDIGKSLYNVGLWQEDNSVAFFENLNLALEYCENQLLSSLYQITHDEEAATGEQESHTSLDIPKAENLMLPSILAPAFASPRQSYLRQAATSTLSAQQAAMPSKTWSRAPQPLPLLLLCFQGLSDQPSTFWSQAVKYFTRSAFPPGHVLFRSGDEAANFYLVEKGMLRASYALHVGTYHESIVAGTTCGELPFFSGTPRTATAVVAEDGGEVIAWCLDGDAWSRMQADWPEGAREMLTVALRLTKERVDAVTSYVLMTAG